MDYFDQVLLTIQFESLHQMKLALENLPKVIGVEPRLLTIIWEMNEHMEQLLKLLNSGNLSGTNLSDFLVKGNRLIEQARTRIRKSTSDVLSRLLKIQRDQMEESSKGSAKGKYN